MATKQEHRRPVVLRLTPFEAETVFVLLSNATPKNRWRLSTQTRVTKRLQRARWNANRRLKRRKKI